MLAAAVGLLVGLVVAIFDRVVLEGLQHHLLGLPLWVIASAPALGLAVSALTLRTIGRGASAATADEYLVAFHDPAHVLGGRVLVARMTAALATLGSGTPMGLEGPSLYAGATIGGYLQRRFPKVFAASDRRLLMVAGAAAGVSAIFKAPLTGVIFALEVPYRNDLARRMLLPALVSSACGYLVFVAVNGTDPLFRVFADPDLSFTDLAGAILVGVIAGVLARLYARMIREAKRVAARRSWLVVASAGAVIAALYAVTRGLTGEDLAVTGGYNVIEWAADPSHTLWLVAAIGLIRAIGTSVAIAGGGTGGIFIPLVVGGTLIGRFVGDLIPGADLALFTVVGAASFLGAGYRVPLAAVAFVAESTGRPGFIVPGLLASVAAELVMGPSSVTPYQVDTTEPGPRPAED